MMIGDWASLQRFGAWLRHEIIGAKMTRQDWLWVEVRAATIAANRIAPKRYGYRTLDEWCGAAIYFDDATHVPRNRAEWAGYLAAAITGLR